MIVPLHLYIRSKIVIVYVSTDCFYIYNRRQTMAKSKALLQALLVIDHIHLDVASTHQYLSARIWLSINAILVFLFIQLDLFDNHWNLHLFMDLSVPGVPRIVTDSAKFGVADPLKYVFIWQRRPTTGSHKAI